MSRWPAPIIQRADIVILRAPEAWRNYNLAIALREGYAQRKDLKAARLYDTVARVSLDAYFARLEDTINEVEPWRP
jgi:hypothetical protein